MYYQKPNVISKYGKMIMERIKEEIIDKSTENILDIYSPNDLRRLIKVTIFSSNKTYEGKAFVEFEDGPANFQITGIKWEFDPEGKKISVNLDYVSLKGTLLPF